MTTAVTAQLTKNSTYPHHDLFNGKIVSYTIKDRPTYELVKQMLDDALEKLSQEKMGDKPIIHLELKTCQEKETALTMQSLKGTLKQEIFYEDTKFTSISELKTTIDVCIYYYNHDRIKSKLKGLSSVKYTKPSPIRVNQALMIT